MLKQEIIIVGMSVQSEQRLMSLIETLSTDMSVEIVKQTGTVERLIYGPGLKSENLNPLNACYIDLVPKRTVPKWFQGSENVNFRVLGKKQNVKYNQRKKIRNNKHKK